MLNRSLETVSLALLFLSSTISVSLPFLVQSELPSSRKPWGTQVGKPPRVDCRATPDCGRRFGRPGRPADGAVPHVMDPRVLAAPEPGARRLKVSSAIPGPKQMFVELSSDFL